MNYVYILVSFIGGYFLVDYLTSLHEIFYLFPFISLIGYIVFKVINSSKKRKDDEIESSKDGEVAATKSEVKGIGGWLIIVIIVLGIGLIYSFFIAITDGITILIPETWQEISQPDGLLYHPLNGPLIIFELIFNIILIVFIIVLLILLSMKKKIFPPLMIIFLLSHFIIETILAFATYNVLTSIPYYEMNELKTALYSSLLGAIIGCAIWVPYFFVSKRVKNTFVK
ncbi:hypothetical protein J2S78_002812 [Salibacterium salarium]|uniref:DUF2569 family protein n=1 Tax=Salibacterium salarium TaxID=284579 RepID=UPI00277DF7F6|nr:DUF2569 family protein [Salibacterium salarium]MDQ0300365.1 hypothetical protein [Salibacterium salarium]